MPRGLCLVLCRDCRSCVSLAFRDAQRHPEKYEDLQVRVCGWNVRRNDLSRAEQDHFVETAEAQR